MSKRTNLNALLFMLVFLPAMVGTTFAEPLFPLDVGLRWEYNRRNNIGSEWTVHMEFDHQETFNSLTYFHLQRWNYYNDGAWEDLGYSRSTEEAVYMYNPSGPEDMVFQMAGVGYVKGVNDWGANPLLTMELISVTAGLDIEGISMGASKDYLDGTAISNPWFFLALIDCVDPGTLHHIDVTPPAGGTPFTIYKGYGYWEWEYRSWPTTYPTLTALQADYPPGNYKFEFCDSSNTVLRTVNLDNSGIGEPGSPVDFTYPSYNGQMGISTNPTFTWTVDSGAGDALVVSLDDYSQSPVPIFVPMDILSWQPGPLNPDQNYRLYVDILRIKDWAGGPGFPTKTVGGDEFEYFIDIGYHNDIEFTTGPTVEAGLDIERIFMKSCKHYVDGTAYSNPWEFKVKVYLVDPGTLHHIDVTPPAGGTPFTIYEDYDYWKYEPPSWYSTLTALQADYPPGNYKFEFCDSSNTVLRTVNLDNSGIGEPGSPVDFTYPSYNGQTGISTNPTFTWTIDSGAGHALGLFLDDDDDEIYKNVPVPMDTLSLQPGPLEAQRNYWLRVSVFMVKDPQSGPDEPTMTVDGDMFKYGLVMEYFNQIEFTTNPTATPHPADKDGDYVIDDFELLDHIDLWAEGQVGDFELLDTIDLWAAGHY